jgi:hypothetical protein
MNVLHLIVKVECKLVLIIRMYVVLCRRVASSKVFFSQTKVSASLHT